MYNSVDVARMFLDVGGPMSSFKLQKLVYLAHENYLEETGNPFTLDTIEARETGPTYVELTNTIGNSSKVSVPKNYLKKNKKVTKVSKKYIKEVWEAIGHHSDEQLSRITRLKNSAWDLVYKEENRDFFSWFLGVRTSSHYRLITDNAILQSKRDRENV